MTIAEAIAQADELRPNAYSEHQKTVWLRRCEAMILKTVLGILEPTEADSPILGSTPDRSAALTVPEPWCELYVHWLEAQGHYANGEYDRYNNAITMFNDALGGYRGEVARKTTSGKSRFLF